jgi:hypothetical protein
MKFVNQLDYPEVPYITRQEMEDEASREKGKKTTVATSACGLCSAIIVVDRLLVNTELSLEEAIRLSYASEANLRIGTDYTVFAPALAERFGLDLEMTDDPERLLFCLRTGGCAVAESAGDREGYIGVFTHNAHYVVVIAEQRDGRFAVLDPAIKEGKYDEEGRRDKVKVKGKFVICDLKTLMEDTEGADKRFYLFWRKEK